MPQAGLVCPYLDRRDARCAEVHTLTNLGEAFRRCADDYESCSVYHQIRLADVRSGAVLVATRSA